MSIVYHADTSRADQQVAQVLANTMVAMEDVENLEADNKRVDKIVAETVEHSERSLISVVRGARQVAQIIRGLAIASGSAINEIYIIGIEAALLTVELVISMQATLAAGTLGVLGVVSAVAGGAQVIALLIKMQQLREGQTEAAARTEGIISSMSALSQLTYLLIPIFVYNILIWILYLLREVV